METQQNLMTQEEFIEKYTAAIMEKSRGIFSSLMTEMIQAEREANKEESLANKKEHWRNVFVSACLSHGHYPEVAIHRANETMSRLYPEVS